MSDLYANDDIRKRAERIVEIEVMYNVSGLISNLAKLDDPETMDVDQEDLYSILSRDDWEEPARDYIRDMDKHDLRSALESVDVDFESLDDEAARNALIEYMNENKDWPEFCDEHQIEPYRTEAYEHWIVSDYLARQLEDRGEMIARDICGLTIWGRPTTGQSISMDSVILQIAKMQIES